MISEDFGCSSLQCPLLPARLPSRRVGCIVRPTYTAPSCNITTYTIAYRHQATLKTFQQYTQKKPSLQKDCCTLLVKMNSFLHAAKKRKKRTVFSFTRTLLSCSETASRTPRNAHCLTLPLRSRFRSALFLGCGQSRRKKVARKRENIYIELGLSG